MEEINEAIDKLLKVGETIGQPFTVEGGNTPFAVIPMDAKVVSLAEYVYNDRSEKPIRIKGTVTVHDY